MRIHEGKQIPWWGRRWKVNYWDGTCEVLPIPICWIARLVYNLWCASLRFRPNAWDTKLRRSYKLGHAHGHSVGHKAGNAAGLIYQNAIATHAAQEAADELFDRIAALNTNPKEKHGNPNP